MNEQEKLIEEQFKTLPPNLQNAIKSVAWKSFVQEIGKQNDLSAEQIEILERETMFIIYAFEPPEDYISNIARELNISEETASTIAESIANKIFEPILKKSEESEEPVKVKPEPIITSAVPEIPPTNLPMVEPSSAFGRTEQAYGETKSAQSFGGAKKGEVVHDVPHVEPTTPPTPSTPPQIKQEEVKAPLPDYRYQEGKDPYREPLS
jgi:hypothetical protein